MKSTGSKCALFLLTAFFMSFSLAFSTQTMLRGNITDKFTGSPEGIVIRVTKPDGKKFKTQSNSITGKYEQLLESGFTYIFTFIRADVVRTSVEVEIPQAEKYEEIEKNLTIEKLTPGLEYKSFNLFSAGAAKFDPTGKNTLLALKKYMRINRDVKFEFIINSNDASSNPSILQSRQSTIKTLFSEKKWKKYARRIKLTTKSQYSSAGASNLTIKVVSTKSEFK